MQPGAAINKSKSQIFSENKYPTLEKTLWNIEMKYFLHIWGIFAINDKFVKPWPSLFGNATWRRNVNGSAANFYSEREFLDFIGGIFTSTIRTGVRHQISNNHWTQSRAIHIFCSFWWIIIVKWIKKSNLISLLTKRTVAAFEPQK